MRKRGIKIINVGDTASYEIGQLVSSIEQNAKWYVVKEINAHYGVIAVVEARWHHLLAKWMEEKFEAFITSWRRVWS